MAHKLNSVRYSDFNGAPFFEDHVDRCSIEKSRTFKRSFVLTSDDVFDYVLNARSVNEHIDDHRQELFEKYAKIQEEARKKIDEKIKEISKKTKISEIYIAMFHF